ncbi:MAG: dethiobiotin synthase [Puniceicoccales bacterium]
MPTIFVSANDTGSGKTWVTASIVVALAAAGFSVDVVKPVETGVLPGGAGDVEFVQETLRKKVALPGRVSVRTLRRFTQPIAPVDAAKRDGETLDFDSLLRETNNGPKADWRIVEGAGGLAVPLEEGESPRDWADFAQGLNADYTVLVVENRLGGINQARLLAHYAESRGLHAGWWLNQSAPNVDAAVREINRVTLRGLAFPLWAAQTFGSHEIEIEEAQWLPA